ncbi:hypothetical protein BIW11_00364 [Tropilaelaps mercedesae]|uniref:Uncharacterized protein n=1 Tax=Tropilaelaps mercedesae TaxID=418985 RepID=A0A1V9XX34_9ACAR|nr:hypothetical protein BIW11_00364 [Tropilaelaps mercedesae]
MIPRLAPLLVVLLWVTQDVSALNTNSNSAPKPKSSAIGESESDDLDSYLHAIDSKQPVSILVPNENVRSSQKFQLQDDSPPRHNDKDEKTTTEAYQTHIPFGTRLKPLTTTRPYITNYDADAPKIRIAGKQSPGKFDHNKLTQPTIAPVRYVASPPVSRFDELRTTPLAERRLDVDEPISIDNLKKLKKRGKLKHHGSLASHKEQRPGKRRPQFSSSPPIDETPALPPSTELFKDAPYDPQPPPPAPPPMAVLRFSKRQKKADFNRGINAGHQIRIAPKYPHLPNQSNRYEPVPITKMTAPPTNPPSRDRTLAIKVKKKNIHFDEVLDFIDKPENLKSPKTSGRKRGGGTAKLFSPKENGKSAFKPIKADINGSSKSASSNKTQPHVNKRIAFLHDHPFQGNPQASFFFTNVGPNHIEYRGVFDPNAVPINFKDSPDALFQLIPQLPKLFDFDTRGIPPPQEPPKPRLSLPTPVIDDPVTVEQLPLAPVTPLRPSQRIPARPQAGVVPLHVPPAGPVALDPPRQVYPLALPPPPNLQLPERLTDPFPKYDYVRGSFDGYPKIFRFNDERISILDFDKQKKAGQVIRRKGDDLDPERVPRNSFLIFHGGHFPSKDDNFGKSRFNSAPKSNRFSNYVDTGNFLEEPEPPRERVFFAPKGQVAPPAPIGLPPQPPIFKADGPQTSFKTTKPGGYIYFIRTG